jgi:hypothetical protein
VRKWPTRGGRGDETAKKGKTTEERSDELRRKYGLPPGGIVMGLLPGHHELRKPKEERRGITSQDFVKSLRRQTAEYFKSKGYPMSGCGYILDSHNNWRSNIILPEVVDYIERRKKECKEKHIPFPLHRYLHHGLSSQACIFNLLGPLLAERDHEALGRIVRLSGLDLSGRVTSAEFEMEDRCVFREKKGQPTSVDLYLETEEGGKVFAEFKFTESEFGTCSVYEAGNCDGRNPAKDLSLCYLHRIGRTYMTLMKKHGLLGTDEPCPFTEFYQAYRLLMFALEKGGVFLLIHDERNPTFLVTQGGVARGRFRRFERLLPKAATEKLFALSIQQIVACLEEDGRHGWLDEFKRKYM